MYKVMNSSLCFTHPALENQPQVKWVIVTRTGFEGYATFEDAYGDYPYQRFIHGFAWIHKVAAQTDRVAKVRIRVI
jgi:hypothetical protein